MKKENCGNESASLDKELIRIAPLVHKIISRKLGLRHLDSVDDIKQKVFLKLWRWKQSHPENDLLAEDWHKLANVIAQNEVTDFFRAKYIRDIPFSQMSEEVSAQVFGIESGDSAIGNSKPEICSLLTLVWKAAQILTFRQKYAYFLTFSDFIVEFIICQCCSIEELAIYFEVTEEQLSEMIEQLPFSDEEIGKLLERRLGVKIAPKQIWEARSKAKAKLAAHLRGSVFNERLFVPGRH